MIKVDTNLRECKVIEVVPRRDGLYLALRDESTQKAYLLITIPLTDLLRYAALVKRVSESPPGFEDLVLADDTIK